jgi:hypothetical protein
MREWSPIGCRRCHYCDALVAGDNVEMDHFPIPKRAGGTETVPACVTCHDMKDRFLQEDWPTELFERALREQMEYVRSLGLDLPLDQVNPEVVKAIVDAHYAWPTHVLENWSRYSREARLLAAKWLALEADLRLEEEGLLEVDGPSVLPVAADPVLHVQAAAGAMTEIPMGNTAPTF